MSDKSDPTPNSEFESIRTAMLILSLILVALGQFLSGGANVDRHWGIYLVTGVGIGMFYLSARAFTRNELSPRFYDLLHMLSKWLGVRPYQVLLICVAPLVSLVAWFGAGDAGYMDQATLAIVAWLTSMAIFLLGYRPSIRTRSRIAWRREDTILLFVLFVISFAIRGILLGDIPWVLSGDEGSAGLTAVQFVEGRRNNIFDLGWYSFPSLFFWIQSISVRALGQTSIALRFPSVIAGALTVPLLYWSTKPFLGRKIALGGSAFLAAFHFHIHFSRIGLNNIWDGLFIVLFSGIFWRAWTESVGDSPRALAYYALAGLTLGLSQYFYTSLRVLVLIFILFLVLRALTNRHAFRKKIPGLISTFIGFIVVVLPLAAFYIKHPDQFAAPFERVSILGTWLEEEIAMSGQSAITILANQFKTAVLGVTSVNLTSWYQPDHPMLLAIPGTLFILASIILLLKLREHFFQWILIWLFGGILISAMSESTPAAQRLTFIAPVVAVLVALPLGSIYEWIAPVIPSRKTWGLLLLSAILGAAIIGDIAFYFGRYSSGQKFGDVNTEVAQAVAGHINTVGDTPTVYFCGLPRMGYYSHSSIRFLAPNAFGEDIPEPIQEPPSDILDGTVIYVFLPERLNELEFVRAAYPNGEEITYKGRGGQHIFTTYTIRSSTN